MQEAKHIQHTFLQVSGTCQGRCSHEYGFQHFLQILQVDEKKKKWEPPVPPPRVGKKQKKRGAAAGLGTKLPNVTPNAKCKLRLLKLERVKDWLLMEEEFVANQERLKPQEERNEEDRSKVPSC